MSGVVGVVARSVVRCSAVREQQDGQHLQVRQSRHGAQTGKTSQHTTPGSGTSARSCTFYYNLDTRSVLLVVVEVVVVVVMILQEDEVVDRWWPSAADYSPI